MMDERDLVDIDVDDDLSEELIEQSRRRRMWVKRVIGSVLALALLVNMISVWPSIINWTAIDFLRTSYQLYQNEEMKERKEAVVSVIGQNGKGTGFVLDPSGVVVTNHHVIEDLTGLYIHSSDGESRVPVIVNDFPELDLAILRVEGRNLSSVSPDFTYEWKKGERVTFIGNPLGFPLVANEGMILGETIVQGVESPVIMIDASVYQGNSGSPVFNEKGNVIAVLFATISHDGDKVGLAVPIRYIEEELLAILKK